MNTSSKISQSAKSDLVCAKDIFRVGLRGKKLILMLACVTFMWLLTIVNLTCNLLLLVFLKVSRDGMESLHFGKTSNGETVVQFSLAETHLEHMISKTGMVEGYQGRNLDVESDRVVLRVHDSGKTVSVNLNGGRTSMEKVDNFVVLKANSARTIFETRNPAFHLQKNIKKISTSILKTKKIRAPIGSPLKFSVDNLSFRGNEGTRFLSKQLKFMSHQLLSLKTGEKGMFNFTVPGGVFLLKAIDLPLSPSPSLKADVLGYRLCSCANSGKLFTVEGNKRIWGVLASLQNLLEQRIMECRNDIKASSIIQLMNFNTNAEFAEVLQNFRFAEAT